MSNDPEQDSVRAVPYLGPPSPGGNDWIQRELAHCHFADERLGKRFRKLVEQLGSGLGEAIPQACQDWANTKAAYRFFSNPRVNEGVLLEGHFASTQQRFAATEGPVLIVHDTTELSFTREKIQDVGIRHHYPHARGGPLTLCGILMHSSLAVTTEGLPLGLTAVTFWTRKKFKGTAQLKRHVNPTRVPIAEKESLRWLEHLQQSTALLADPTRCVHVGDRASDIYELFCAAQESGTQFLLRTCVDRLAENGQTKTSAVMQDVPVKAVHCIEVLDRKGCVSQAVLEIKYRRLRVYAPEAKRKQYGPLMLTVIYARERDQPTTRDRIDWKLITNLPVQSRAKAIEKLDWYALRWKIELFHKILKSGCKAEASQLRTANRLVNLVALLCILSWRVFWLTMMNRVAPNASPLVALTSVEVALLDHFVKDKGSPAQQAVTLTHYLVKIARLGGYLARSSDAPPGNLVMWRGLSRLTDIEIGFQLGTQSCG